MGKLIVLEGLDGCGKETQSKLLVEFLSSFNKFVQLVSFPNYNCKSAALIKQYLSGEILSNVCDVNPYAVASFYAANRYVDFITNWKKSFESGAIIIADRYVGSNLIHQMVKLKKSEWGSFIKWVQDFEFNKLELPREDFTIFLKMQPEISQNLAIKRNPNNLDFHEKNLNYLSQCQEAANFAAENLNWKTVVCDDGQYPLSINLIFSEIKKIIENLI